MVRNESKDWIVVGSSPGVERYFDGVIEAMPNANTITANAGIGLFYSHVNGPIAPDYYWLSDMKACELFKRYWKAARLRGTKGITFRRDRTAMIERGVADADIKIEAPLGAEQPRYEPGRYIHPKLSGLMITQFALNNGAERIVWLGMEGYRSTPNNVIPDTFDNRHGKPSGWSQTQNFIRPFFQSCIDRCPHVSFVMIGRPSYELSGNNYVMTKRINEVLCERDDTDQIQAQLATV